ncbi:hypothetical protein [Nitrogeniibacter aestuarii]|uniref:hypothetical protein n=1 Tax=Nitrogeniibacter aestuarii TaxID=2815343 RepID=UPI001D11E1AA|nr:hypothetical protein [Nitrogeniibacter aestuarii]
MNAHVKPDDLIDPAEARLRASRERLKQRLSPRTASQASEHEEAQGGDMSPSEMFDTVVKPATEEIVRRYPVRSLAAATAVGALAVRIRPWQGLIGSIIATTLIRKGSTVAAAWAMDKAADALEPQPGQRPPR